MAPLSIGEVRTSGLQREITLPGLGEKITLKDLAVMSRQMATMISAGLTLLRTLSILADQTERKPLAKVLAQTRSDVETGSALSDALGRHRDVFPPLMINMIRAGEVGGFLEDALSSVAQNYEAEVKLKGQIKSAMTYPVMVFVMAILAVIGMLLFIVPVFVGLFSGFDAQLPAPTRFLVFLSGLMKFFAPLGVVGLIAFSIVWPKVKRKDGVRNVLDPLKLKLPVFGLLFQKIACGRVSPCRNR